MTGATPATWQIIECLGAVVSPLGATVHVKAASQMLDLSFEEALHRIEEFTEPSQDIVLGVLTSVYSVPGYRVMYLTPLERQLIKNMRAMEKAYSQTMWEVIDDLAEKSYGRPPANAVDNSVSKINEHFAQH